MKDAADFRPDYTMAARKALLVHPEKQSCSYALDEVAGTISECMERGCPEMVVMLWGRELALTFLAVLHVEGPAVDALYQSIESGLSFWDDLGDSQPLAAGAPDSKLSERLGALSHEAYAASRAGKESEEELALRELLTTTFRLHKDKLPQTTQNGCAVQLGGEEGDMDVSIGAGFLYGGAVGPFVYAVGREFAAAVADGLPELGLFSLYALLSHAVRVCKTPYDNVGHLDQNSKELMLWA